MKTSLALRIIFAESIYSYNLLIESRLRNFLTMEIRNIDNTDQTGTWKNKACLRAKELINKNLEEGADTDARGHLIETAEFDGSLEDYKIFTEDPPLDFDSLEGGLPNYASETNKGRMLNYVSTCLLVVASTVVFLGRVRLKNFGPKSDNVSVSNFYLNMWKADIQLILKPRQKLAFALARVPDALAIAIGNGWVNRRMNLLAMMRCFFKTK